MRDRSVPSLYRGTGNGAPRPPFASQRATSWPLVLIGNGEWRSWDQQLPAHTSIAANRGEATAVARRGRGRAVLGVSQVLWTGSRRLASGDIRCSGRSMTHLLRVLVTHHASAIFRPPLIVVGERNRRSRAQPQQGSSVRRNASVSDCGNAAISITGTRRARATFQKGV